MMVPPRRPLRDNPRLILAGMIVLLAALVGIVALANRSAGLSPDFLTEFVLYGLWAADLTILLGLTFVLARNVIKLIVERRRALPFARFRGKLVAVLLGMTLVPAVLVLLVGSELIRNSVDRWFNAPVEEVLTAADLIASDYYRDRQVRRHRRRRSGWPARLAGAAFDGADVAAVRDRILPEVTQGRVKMVEVYRVTPGTQPAEVMPYVDVAAPDMPHGYARAVADRMAAHAASGQVRAADARAAAGRRRADSRGGRRAAGRDVGRRSPSSSPAIRSPASWRRAPAAFRTRTRTTRSFACCGSRSPASISRSS